jgi:hypothetical protein
MAGAVVSLDAALMSLGPRAHLRRPIFVYRAALFGAALLSLGSPVTSAERSSGMRSSCDRNQLRRRGL